MKKYFVLLFIYLFFLLSPIVMPVQALETANPNAGLKTKQLLDYLGGLPDKTEKKVISGQHIGANIDGNFNSKYKEYISDVYSNTGKKIGLLGIDFLYCWDSGNMMLETTTEHWNNGGLVAVTWHMWNPWTGDGVNCTGGGGGSLTINGSLADLYNNPSSAAYIKWHADLDKKALFLSELQNRGVVVLFRPFHEMNGPSWSWWGARKGWTAGQYYDHQSKFKLLWQHLFNYYKAKGLNNLLWVYSPNFSPEGSGYKNAMFYYPGDAYADVVGLDYYYYNYDEDSDYSGLFEDIATEGYSALITTGKPFAITEFGPGSGGSEPPANIFNYSLLIKEIKDHCPKTVYFMPWSYNYSIARQNGTDSLLSNSWILNSGEISFDEISPSSFTIGDVDHSGEVDSNDILMILMNYSKIASGVAGYFDPADDNKINLLDFGLVIKNWGQ